MFKNIKQEDIFATTDEKEDYYKVTERADIIDDVGEEVQNQEVFIKRTTVVHKPTKEAFQDHNDPNQMYKIEGIEFLPEGFIELDPLLFKDEFEFDNKVMEELFKEDQMRTKMLRRKQYEERNLQKMREVTIYVLDEKKQQIIEYLEKWYFKNKRRMNEDELRYVAELMKTDVTNMAQLQDYYLKRKQLTNTRQIKEYLRKNGKLEGDKLNVPDSLRKYFIRSQDQYSHVEPRVMDEKAGYNPVFLDKHKKYFKRPKSSNRKPGLYSKTGEMDRTIKKFGKTGKQDTSDINEVMDFNHLSASLDVIANKASVNVNRNAQTGVDIVPQDKNEQQNTSGNDQDMRLYYDSEINTILNKIKGYKAVYKDDDPRLLPNDCDVDINNTKGLMNCEKVIKDDVGGSQKFVDSFKQRVLQGEQVDEKNNKVSITSKLEKYQENTDYKEWAYTQIHGNQGEYNVKGKSLATAKKSSKTKVTQKQSFGKKMGIEDVVKLKRIGKLMSKGKLRDEGAIDNKALTTDEMIVEPLELPKRVTLVSRNGKGESVVTQKLRPTLIGDEYYYQTVNELVDEVGNRKATVVTKDGSGQIVDEQQIADDYVGQLYENGLFIKEDSETKERKITLAVYNERGETVAVTEVESKANIGESRKNTYKEIINENNETMNCIQETRKKSTLARISKMRPTLVGNQYYHQIVEEYINSHGKRQLTVKTFNEEGRCLATNAIEDHLAADAYYSLIINETIDELGNRKATLVTINDKNVTLLTQTISPTIKDKLAEEYYRDLYEEVVDDADNRKISVIYKISDKKEVVVVNDVLPRETFDMETIIKQGLPEQEEEEEEQDAKKNKGKSRAGLNDSKVSRGSRGRRTEDKPKKKSTKTKKAADQYYKGTIDDLLDERKKSKKARAKELLANKYYNDLVIDLAKRKRQLAPHKRYTEYGRRSPTMKGKSKTMLVKAKDKSSKDGIEIEGHEEVALSMNDPELSYLDENPEIVQKMNNMRPEADDNKKERVEIYNKSLKKIPFSGYKADKLSLALPRNLTHVKAKKYTFDPLDRTPVNIKALGETDAFKKKKATNKKKKSEDRQAQTMAPAKKRKKPSFEDRNVEKRHSIGGRSDKKKKTKKRNTVHPTDFQEKMSNYDEEDLKRKITEVLKDERGGMDDGVREEIARKMDDGVDQDLMDEFFEYCKNYLPSDFRYKESVLFVTLFYYFMKKENLVN